MCHNSKTNSQERGPCGGLKSGRTKRFGISANEALLEKFDGMIAAKGYTNRSEAIRSLIRDQLVEYAWAKNNCDVVGTITYVYEYASSKLIEELKELQHRNHAHIISSLHVHLDGQNCLEVLIIKGQSDKVRQISDRLIGAKGVKHGKLTMSTTGEGLSL